jgi:hypothetical protein
MNSNVNNINSTSRKGSAQNSKNLKSKSSLGMKEDNTIDTGILQNNLQEFYRNSKQKLTQLKSEVDLIESENLRQKEENILYGLKSNELQILNEELGLRLKGMKEKLIASQRNRFNMQNQVRDLKRDIESTSRKIDTVKIDNNFKIQMIQNDIDHTQLVKENSVKSIKKKTENELAHQINLLDKMKEIQEEIYKYKNLVSELEHQDNDRYKLLHKETAEMTKFLSEL